MQLMQLHDFSNTNNSNTAVGYGGAAAAAAVTSSFLECLKTCAGFLRRPWNQGLPALKSPWISDNWKSAWTVLENEWKALKSLEFVYPESFNKTWWFGECANLLP